MSQNGDRFRGGKFPLYKFANYIMGLSLSLDGDK